MKVNFKRVATAALAVAMSLSLNVSAFAAVGDPVENGNLTVTGDQLDGKYVYAIQMFEARAQEGNGAYTFDSYELIDVWEDFFKDKAYFTDDDWKAADVIKEGETAAAITNYSDAALAYVEWLADENQKEKLMTFANDAKKWAESKNVFTRTYGEGDQASVLQDVEVTSAWSNYARAQKATKVGADETKGTTTFEGLNTGYYLVYPEGGSTGKAGQTQGVYTDTARGTDAMLINIPTNEDSTTWNIKSTYPTVDKTVDTDNGGDGEADDNGSAQVGDTVTFTLTSKVPDMTDYETFYFAFNDTMSKGLEFVEKTPNDGINANDVTVKINDVDVKSSKYTVTYDARSHKLSVVFTDLKKVTTETGATITVTYQAKITEEAVSTDDNIFGTAENEANVEYSNDPNSGGHGTSTPDESKVYTYQIGVHKYTGDWSSSAAYLPGAKFVLSKSEETPSTPYDSDENVIKLVGSDNEYCVATADDVENTTYEFTTNDAGEIVIKGLEAGTYYLHEVAAPDGYNKLKEPIKITISVSGGNASLEAPVYTIGSTANTAKDDTVGVQNKKGIELPETGSIGTIGLTALGVVVVVAGLFAFPRKKKTRQD